MVFSNGVFESYFKLMSDQSPAQHGFRMPAEWERHATTWTAWPRDNDYWGGVLEAARQDFAVFLAALACWETVQLLVHDAEAEADVQQRLGNVIASGRIQLHTIPQRDIWLRDIGPMFIRRGQQLQAVNWDFNGWGDRFPSQLDNQVAGQITASLGLSAKAVHRPKIVFEGGAIDVNGAGLAITTRQCLLSPNRNSDLNSADLEQYLHNYLGIDQVIWLEKGLQGDHTDGHVDTITRFIDRDRVITMVCNDSQDANHAPLQDNLETLKAWRNQQGQGLEVIPLPLPDISLWFEGERLPLTYANFYIANGAVLVPTFDCIQDQSALEILRSQFPHRQVIGLPARGLFQGGGGFHCATQQQPVGHWL